MGAWTDSSLIFTTEVGTLIHPWNFERTFKGLLEEAKKAWTKEAADAQDLVTLDQIGPRYCFVPRGSTTSDTFTSRCSWRVA